MPKLDYDAVDPVVAIAFRQQDIKELQEKYIKLLKEGISELEQNVKIKYYHTNWPPPKDRTGWPIAPDDFKITC